MFCLDLDGDKQSILLMEENKQVIEHRCGQHSRLAVKTNGSHLQILCLHMHKSQFMLVLLCIYVLV